MTIFLQNKNNKHICYEYHVHDYHECDMFNFLKYNDKKQELCLYEKPNNIQWFKIKLSEKDIDYIKNTSWYHNIINYDNNINKYLTENFEIKVLIIEPKIE